LALYQTIRVHVMVQGNQLFKLDLCSLTKDGIKSTHKART